jgi:signal transduction histidine kinase
LRALVQESRGNGLTVELVTNELDENLPIPVSTALLDAARLALITAARSAGATRTVVRAVARPDGVQITIRDHGGRSDQTDNPDGLEWVDQDLGGRLRAVGGRVDVWSAPGRGTRVTLWVPA